MFGKSIRNGISIITLLLLLPIINSCSYQQEAPPEPQAHPQAKFYLWLIPEQDLFSQKERYAPLARYLSAKTGVDVEHNIHSRY